MNLFEQNKMNMKKTIVTLATVTMLGCTHNNQAPSDYSEDSALYLIGKMVVVLITDNYNVEYEKD